MDVTCAVHLVIIRRGGNATAERQSDVVEAETDTVGHSPLSWSSVPDSRPHLLEGRMDETVAIRLRVGVLLLRFDERAGLAVSYDCVVPAH